MVAWEYAVQWTALCYPNSIVCLCFVFASSQNYLRCVTGLHENVVPLSRNIIFRLHIQHSWSFGHRELYAWNVTEFIDDYTTGDRFITGSGYPLRHHNRTEMGPTQPVGTGDPLPEFKAVGACRGLKCILLFLHARIRLDVLWLYRQVLIPIRVLENVSNPCWG
jgi:hypothetical protein